MKNRISDGTAKDCIGLHVMCGVVGKQNVLCLIKHYIHIDNVLDCHSLEITTCRITS